MATKSLENNLGIGIAGSGSTLLFKALAHSYPCIHVNNIYYKLYPEFYKHYLLFIELKFLGTLNKS